MVKELTMDNTIFGLGSAKNMNAVEPNVGKVSNEFEKVFETTQYADKSELKADNQKVLKAAEKSVSRENDSLKKDAATDITRVNKKVSAKLTSKSPKNAGLDSSTTSDVPTNGPFVETIGLPRAIPSIIAMLTPSTVVANTTRSLAL